MEREYSYVLRTCNGDMTSRNGFTWPVSGMVEAPDWDPTPKCGGGLHSFLNGCGDPSLADWSESAKWLVVKVVTKDIVSLDNGLKVKFPRGEVVFAGDRLSALQRLEELAPECLAMPVMGSARIVGDRGTATAGPYGHATAGHYGTATAGVGGHATAGHYGTAQAGYGGNATAAYKGNATAGDWGKAQAGDWGKAQAGDYGTATASRRGIAIAGVGGRIQIEWLDGSRYRLAVGYIGEGSLEPNTPYQCDNKGNFVKAETPK